jgi:hypothetical protein
MPISKETTLTAIRPLTETTNTQKNLKQLQQKSMKNSAASLTKKTASLPISWKKLDDWQFLHMRMQNLSIRKQRSSLQKPSDFPQVSDTLQKRRKLTRTWHSLPKLLNRSTKRDLNSRSSEVMQKDLTITAEGVLIFEEKSSPLIQEVDLDNCQTNNIFLGEATQTRNSTTTSNDCNHHHRNNNEVPKHLPILFSNTSLISKPPLQDTRGWDITRGTAPILQPILGVHDPPLLAIGGNTRRISNTMELNSTKMEISPNEISIRRGMTGSRSGSG